MMLVARVTNQSLKSYRYTKINFFTMCLKKKKQPKTKREFCLNDQKTKKNLKKQNKKLYTHAK